MRRRPYLAACAVLVAPAAGCTGDDSTEATETEAAAEQTAYEDAFRDALAREGIEILELAYDDGRVILDYEPAEPTEAGVEESVEVAARAYFDRVYGGWSAQLLDASAYVDGSLVATWRMETAWIDAYLAGDITRDELGRRVEDSVERHDGASDGESGRSGADGDEGTDDGDETKTDRDGAGETDEDGDTATDRDDEARRDGG